MDTKCLDLAFSRNRRIESRCLACDFINDADGNPLLVEISYGFIKRVYDPCPGYWTEDLTYVEGGFDPQGWMVELLRAEESVLPQA